ncbi:hypothetical protein AVEN_69340-1 [Araneus ventricosus]|uniref:Uncharacterized protein n=1 Tax=Araneus ventricosus TaxID=182803 RepID=A0A4Y2P4H9_ARAVE|nr:hypothetical protein AVEN_69340-1 [Araneus ventricosus]
MPTKYIKLKFICPLTYWNILEWIRITSHTDLLLRWRKYFPILESLEDIWNTFPILQSLEDIWSLPLINNKPSYHSYHDTLVTDTHPATVNVHIGRTYHNTCNRTNEQDWAPGPSYWHGGTPL